MCVFNKVVLSSIFPLNHVPLKTREKFLFKIFYSLFFSSILMKFLKFGSILHKNCPKFFLRAFSVIIGYFRMYNQDIFSLKSTKTFIFVMISV